MAGILPRTALAAATLALLAMSGAMAIEEPQDVTEIVQEDVPVVDSPAKASMSHARGGLNAAVADLASLSTVRASGAPGREASLGAVQASEAHPEFQAFVEKHKGAGHDYCPESAPGQPCAEALRRELSFLENKAIIEAHNARPDATFQMGQTPFADFTGDEFKHKLLKYDGKQTLTQKRADKLARVEVEAKGLNIPGVESPANLGRRRPKDVSQFPRKFDWAEVPEVMGKIHTQETSCASCWAYTSTDTIEAQVVISGRRDKHVELSAEQLINCDGYDSGCNTGNMFTAYEWIHENGGLATARAFHGAAAAAGRSAELSASASASAALGAESEGDLGIYFRELPAEDERKVLDSIESGLGSSNGNCPGNLQLQDRVFGYCELDFEAGEAALMEAVSKHPVAIGINANKVFQLYASGIISAKDCGPAPHTQDSEIMAINHAVVVTGWGEQMVKGRNMKYWILKNSFGEQWGEGGYFKLERGDHTLDAEGFGTCGMYFESVYPVLDEKAGPEACVPGSTFRTKYYSAAGAAFLGDAADGSSPRTRGIELGGEGRVAATMLALGFAAGLAAALASVAVTRVYRWSRRANEEGAALLPN